MILIIIILTGALHLLILSQLTFTAWPEMLSYPYLLSNGYLLYKDFIMPYPPGLVLILSSVFNMFGFSPFILKIFTWILILFTDLLIYAILKKISKSNLISFLFLIFYVFLQSFLDGNMLWFDFAGVLPLLLALYFAINWLNSSNLKYLFLIGVFLSIAVIIKQVNILYIFIFGLICIFQKKRIVLKEILYFITGCLIILIPGLFYIFSINAIYEFWNWVILYPITQWSQFPGYVDFNFSKRQAIISLILFAPLFFSIIYWKKFIKDKIFLIILFFLITSLITVYPRFSFFHMQPAIAFLIIILAKIFNEVPQKLKTLYLISILITTLLIMILSFKSVVGDKIRFYESQDLQLSEEIMQNTKNSQTIYLLGINSSEYIFTNTLPPKNWSDNFGWYLEIPGVQEWVIHGLENEQPNIIFWKIPSNGQWYALGVYQPREITNYIRLNYHKTGKIKSDIEIWTKN